MKQLDRIVSPDTNVDVYSKLLRWPLLASTPRQQQTEATRG